MQNKFEPICRLPIAEGDTVTALAVWEALGQQCIAVATREQMFILKIAGADVEFAGPLEFTMQEKHDAKLKEEK